MAITPSQGLVMQGLGIADERIMLDRSQLLKWVRPDNAPYYMLYNALAFQSCMEEKFEWGARTDFQATIEVGAAYVAGGGTLTVAGTDWKLIKGADLLYCHRTGETFYIKDTPSSASVAIQAENWPTGGSGSGLAIGDKLVLLGPAMGQASEPVDTISMDTEWDYNYIQLTRRGWKVEGRSQAISVYGPDPLSKNEEDNARQFMREQEVRLLFGTRGRASSTITGIGGSKATTSSGGILYFMSKSGSRSLSQDFSGTPFTKAAFDAFLKDVFQAGGGDTRTLLCGPNLVQMIDDWAWAKVVPNDMASKELGVHIRTYLSSWGNVNIMPHRLWSDYLQSTGMGEEAWIIDPSNMIRRGLPGRSTVGLTVTRGSSDLQTTGADYIHREMNVEDGLELRSTETFARAYGIGA